MLLKYLQVDYEHKEYLDMESWFNVDKPKLGLPFANVPYIIDGDFKLCESVAVLRYLSEKYNADLVGKDIQQRA